MVQIDERRYRIGIVSKAVGVPAGALRTQVRRGLFTAASSKGEWDKYSLLDSAEIAALNHLTDYLEWDDASKVMAHIKARQHKFWRQAIELAVRDQRDVFVYVVLNADGSFRKSFLYAGRKSHSLFAIRDLFLEDDSTVMIINVGGPIAAALERLQQS